MKPRVFGGRTRKNRHDPTRFAAGSHGQRRARLLVGIALLALAASTWSFASVSAIPGSITSVALGQQGADLVLFLVGDSGKSKEPSDPVLSALAAQIEQARAENPSGEVIVTFLGDNIYEHGLPDERSSNYRESVRRLLAQVEVVGPAAVDGRAAARGIFVPGNHDWDRGGDDGWDAIRRQGSRLEQAAGELGTDVTMLPQDGCPGPAIVDAGGRLRLIVLDTQWFLHDGPKPAGAESPCANKTEADVLAALEAALAGAGGRRVAVLAHHPLATGGRHGGYLPIRWWAFPVDLLHKAYRSASTPRQDTGSSEYTALITSFESVFDRYPPLIFAAGHDHNLQVLEGESPRYVLVSGSASKSTSVGELKNSPYSSLYWTREHGFMRLDIMADGRARLVALVVEDDEPLREDFSLWLDGGD